MLGIKGIDHPVVAVLDMVEAHRRYAAMGFTIPPRGSHLEWGTGNWCIMFGDDYLELRGIVDPDRYTHHLGDFLAEREGLMGVAFAAKSADDTWENGRAANIAMSEPRELTRRFELPEGDAFPRFRLTFMEPDECPGLMRSLVCEHLTPELIRRPDWLSHPNGAVGVSRIVAVATDFANAEASYARVFGEDVSQTQDEIRVPFGERAQLVVLSPENAVREGFDLPGVTSPYLAALTIDVSDINAAQRVMEDNHVPFTQSAPDSIRVGPYYACGAVLEFRQA